MNINRYIKSFNNHYLLKTNPNETFTNHNFGKFVIFDGQQRLQIHSIGRLQVNLKRKKNFTSIRSVRNKTTT